MTIISTPDQGVQGSSPPVHGIGPLDGRLPEQMPSAGSMTGKDILHVLRKRKWLIILTALIISAVTSGVTLLWWLYAPLYTAVARLVVTPPTPSELRGQATLYNQEIMNRLMETHARLALSDPVLQNAAKNPLLTKTAWYNKDREGAVERLAEDVSVRPVPGTNYIQVSLMAKAVTYEHRTDLAQIVNAVSEEFEKYSRSSISSARVKNIVELKKVQDGLVSDRNNVLTRIRGIQQAKMSWPSSFGR